MNVENFQLFNLTKEINGSEVTHLFAAISDTKTGITVNAPPPAKPAINLAMHK